MAQHRAAPAAADLVTAAVRGIRQIYRPGYELIKAGVMQLEAPTPGG